MADPTQPQPPRAAATHCTAELFAGVWAVLVQRGDAQAQVALPVLLGPGRWQLLSGAGLAAWPEHRQLAPDMTAQLMSALHGGPAGEGDGGGGGRFPTTPEM